MKVLTAILVISMIAVVDMPPLLIKNGQAILDKSIQKYDPDSKWPALMLKAHIQEPRPSVPHRYSIVTLDAGTGYFQLQRNRADKIATYSMEADGSMKVLIDGQSDFPEEWREKYRLDLNLVPRYQRSYRTFYGLPMTLNQNLIEEILGVAKVTFNRKVAYRIHISLHEPLFTKEWYLFVDKNDYSLLGIEMFAEENGTRKGERLLFEGTVAVDGITIPRIKHWYDLESGDYSGSDVLLKLLD